MDGKISFGKDYKNKRRLIITSIEDQDNSIEILIPRGKHLTVQEGDIVKKGEFIVDGT